VTALSGISVFAGILTLLTLPPKDDFEFANQIDTIRTNLAVGFVVFASSLFVGISVLILFREDLNTKHVPMAFKQLISKAQIIFMSGFIVAGFTFLNAVLINIDHRSIAAVGNGFLITIAVWILISTYLDTKGWFRNTVFRDMALTAGLQAVSRFTPSRICPCPNGGKRPSQILAENGPRGGKKT
jgi:hypothetical protein